MKLVLPAPEHLPSYVDALHRGWSPDNIRGAAATREALEAIQRDPQRYLEWQDDREAKAPPVELPNGTTRKRLPGYHRWLWDGEFCGVIGFRWQPGTSDLPPHVLGHIGYAVVPWKRGRGYATSALAQLLLEVRNEGLDHVEITMDYDNAASRRVVESNGGKLVERFLKPAAFGGHEGLRFRIDL